MLVLVCIAQFMVILDATIVNVALPSIQHGLHFSATGLQWIVNGYTLVFGGFLLLGGRASDLLGRQRLFIAGVIVFTSRRSSTASRRRPAILIGGRALQGLGARARLAGGALDRHDHVRRRARSARRRSASGARSPQAAALSGLVLGGLLTETLSWRWVFFVNLPIGHRGRIAVAALHLRTRAPRSGRRPPTSPGR